MTGDLPLGQLGAPAPGPGLNALVEAYATARSIREEAASRLKNLQAIEDRATADLFDALERLNLRMVRHDTLGTFSLNDLAWPKIVDAELAREWAQTEFPEAITLNQQRLQVIVREAIKGERDMPPGVDFVTSRKISWRGGVKITNGGDE